MSSDGEYPVRRMPSPSGYVNPAVNSNSAGIRASAAEL
jgi:hypothetical protein